ncbi:MAG: molybdopterin-containing oxidoreductase family protein [Panacagrimonas sp.]
MTKETHLTLCAICEQSCGLSVTVEKGRITKIEPDKEHPYTWRDFCTKGAHAHDVVYHPRRITQPMRRVGDRYVPATYEEAISDIAARLNKTIEQYGPNAVGAYGGNPAAFSFENPTFMTAFLQAIGTHQWFWVGSIDTNAMHVVCELMFGSPWLYLGIDVDDCKCFLMIGTNPAESTHCWGGNVPDGWKRVLAAQEKGADVIVVDPRRTPTAAKANLHIAIKPGEDWAFLLGVLKEVFAQNWLHAEDCARTRGIEQVRALTEQVTFEQLASRCEVTPDTMRDVARRFATAASAHCITRTGPGQSRNGSLAEWLSIVLNTITGRIERPGGRVYSPGLFDQIKSAESLFPPSKIPSRVRGLVPVGGAHTLAELPDEINTPGEGQIRAFVIHAGNPVVSGPNGGALDEAFAKLDLLVAVDFVQRESHRHAHWLMPGVHFLERTEVNPLIAGLHDQPFVQMARAVVPPPPGVRPEWEFFADVVIKMKRPLFGMRAFNWLIQGSRWLARVTGNKKLSFDPMWLSRMMIWQGKRAKWRDIVNSPRGVFYAKKSFGALWKELRTTDKKIDLAPEPLVKRLQQVLAEAPASQTTAAFPLQMISRRRVQNMNSWLADVTGKTARPFPGDLVEVNTQDAARLGIAEGQTLRLVSKAASLEARAAVSGRVRPGVVVLEQGWGSGVFDPNGVEPPERYGVNRNLLIANDDLDPLSCMPQLNGTQVRIEAMVAVAA